MSCGCGKVDVKLSQPETDIDDVWADDDSTDDYTKLADQATADLKRAYTKKGYLDGLTRAQESSLQQGFDDSFPKGAELGIEVGRLLAIIYSYSDEKLISEAKKELNISKVLDGRYFNENLELVDDHLLRKWAGIADGLSRED